MAKGKIPKKPKSATHFKAREVQARLLRVEITTKHVELDFYVDEEELTINEELDILDEHTLFRFSMFLEGFGIKDLKQARQHLNIFIKEKITIGLMINQLNEIIYSNSLKKDQKYEFKKMILLTDLKRQRKITKDMYDEMKDLTYKEVRSIVS